MAEQFVQSATHQAFHFPSEYQSLDKGLFNVDK